MTHRYGAKRVRLVGCSTCTARFSARKGTPFFRARLSGEKIVSLLAHVSDVAFDPEHRLVVSVVPGKHTAKNVRLLLADFKKRTQGRIMNLITTDEYPVYATEILAAYGTTVDPTRTGKPGCPRQHPYKVPPSEPQYATVHKTREKGTAFVERHNGTDRIRLSFVLLGPRKRTRFRAAGHPVAGVGADLSRATEPQVGRNKHQ